jgi:hypothetical protein
MPIERTKLRYSFAKVLVLCLGVLLRPGWVYAQTVTSGADFLQIDSSARSAGMGSAFVAAADDVNALAWNPAGLSLVEGVQLGYLYLLYPGGISYNFGGGVYSFANGKDRVALGAAVINLGTGLFDSTQGSQPSVSASDNAFQLSLAYRLGDELAFGVSGQYLLEQIAGYNAGGIDGDFGILWTPGSCLRLGAGVFHIGPSLSLNSVPDPLPTTGRLGLACTLPGDSISLMISGEGDDLLNQNLLSGSVGAEVWCDRLLALRGGYTGTGGEAHGTFGVGIDLKVARVDYAYAPLSLLGDSHRFSLTLCWDDNKGPAPPEAFQASLGDKSIVLSWKASPSAAGYNLYLKKPGDAVYIALNHHPLRDLTANLRGDDLTPGIYRFALAAVDERERESERLTAEVLLSTPKVLRPDAVTGFKAVFDEGQIRLDWDGESAGQAAEYNLYLADGAGQKGKLLSAQPLTQGPVRLTAGGSGKTYRFFITRIEKNGHESDPAMAEVQIPVTSVK